MCATAYIQGRQAKNGAALMETELCKTITLLLGNEIVHRFLKTSTFHSETPIYLSLPRYFSTHHCSFVGPHMGTLVSIGTKIIFLVPISAAEGPHLVPISFKSGPHLVPIITMAFWIVVDFISIFAWVHSVLLEKW